MSVDITPPATGTYQLEVRAKDTVTWGASQIVSFLVKAGEGPVGRWRFDEASGAAVDFLDHRPREPGERDPQRRRRPRRAGTTRRTRPRPRRHAPRHPEDRHRSSG
ncbi:hypothetical protein SCALM49S_06539 [Streptomyces californicus]